MAWGEGDLGQLGNGTSRGISLDGVVVQRLSHVRKIVSDGATTLAIAGQGTVKARGYNGYGALGTGDFRDHLRPTRVRGLRHSKRIYTDEYQTSFALQRNGTLWAWGYGYDGNRGDGTRKTCSSQPRRVRLPAPVVGLFVSPPPPATYRALLSDGTGWTWGSRSANLGYPSRHKVFRPRRVRGLPAVQTVWPGQGATYVRDRQGRIWAWGDGPLGDGKASDSARPLRIAGIDGATDITLSDDARFAILPDGSVQSWGRNFGNAAGTSTLDPVLHPTALPGLVDVRDVGESLGAGYAWGDGSFKAWGSSYDAYARPQEVPWGPRTVAGLTGLRRVAPWSDTNRDGMSCTVLLADGTVQRLTVPFQQPTG